MKYIIYNLILSCFLVASSLQWSSNYHMTRQKAKKMNKNILLFISSKDNPFCESMEEDTFKNDMIVKYIKKNYLVVRLYIEDHTIPGGIKFFSVPSLYFLTPKGKAIHQRVVGLVTVGKLKNILLEIENKNLNI